MDEITSIALSFIGLILLSNLLKRRGVLKTEDKDFLSSILINICLPCVIISGFRDFQYSTSLIVAILICVGISITALFLGYMITRKQGRDSRILHMMTSSGYNIGIFTIPFVSSIFTQAAVVCVLMFDIGNAIFVFGTSAAITSYAVDGDKRNPLPALLKKLFSTTPFIIYMIMLAFQVLHVTIVDEIYVFVDLCASATSFLAMILVGIMIEIEVDRSELASIISALILRYTISFSAAAIIFFSTIFETDLKKALMIALCSPVSTASVVFSQKLNCKSSLIGAVSSLSIVISIMAIMSIALFL